MKILAVIPCRKNSTRVPDKNLLQLGPRGKSNLVRTIHVVKQCEHIKVVAVVSDDPKTRNLACMHGCLALCEPVHVARHGDLYDVMDFALRKVKGDWEAVALAYPNVPIRPANLFNDLTDKLIVTKADSVTALVRDRGHAGGSIFGLEYLRQMIVDRTAIDRHDWRIIDYRQDEIVEIDSLEDVTWANTLLNADDYQ